MDEEHPRTESSINNRSHLRQILNLEDLYRKNKVGDKELNVMRILLLLTAFPIEHKKNPHVALI